jgi:hypothetical protein
MSKRAKATTLLLLLYSVTLFARENPFAPVEETTLQSEPLLQPAPKPDTQIIQIINSVTCKVVEKPEPKPSPQKVWSKPLIQKVEKTTVIKPKPPLTGSKRVVKIKRHTARYKTIYHDQNLHIQIKGRHIKILTRDTLVKHFRLTHPNRLVLDFGDDFILFPSVNKKIHSPYIRRLKIGTHPCYYRVTLELTNKRRYKVKRVSNGYLITLF